MKVPKKADIQKFFKSDRAILIACIFIALIFWLLVKLSQTFSTSADYLISYQLPAGKTFVSSPPSSVIATIKGSGWDLISYQFRNQVSEINYELTNIGSQTVNPKLLTDKIQQTIATPLEVSGISLDYFLVQLEEEAQKKVPVVLVQDIQLAPQFQLADSIQLEIDSVIITGPSTEVESIVAWETELLQVKDIKNNQEIQLNFKKPDNEELHISPANLLVQIKVEQFTEKSLFVPIQIKNAPDSLKTFPETAKLNCIVGISKFNSVSNNSFDLVVDLKDIPLNTEKNTVPVLLKKQPDFVRAVNFQPRSVEFFFVKVSSDSLSTIPSEN